RGHGRRRGRERRYGGASRARPHDRSRSRCPAPRRRRISRGGRGGARRRARRSHATARVTRLLIRDLRQGASPAGRAAPLHGRDRETQLASLRATRAAGGVPTWLGPHAVPREFADADAYLEFALREVLPDAARIAEAADVFVERGAFDAQQARRYLDACTNA